MHRAPALSFPVGRSRFQLALLALTGALGLLAGLLWYSAADLPGWRQYAVFLAWLLAAVHAFWSWRHTAAGSLHWDGQSWNLSHGQLTRSGSLRAHLDLQSCMVLSLHPADASRVWLCPERSADPQHWDALRRAVFCGGATKGHPAVADANSAPR